MDELEFREKMLEIRRRETKVSFWLFVIGIVVLGITLGTCFIGEIVA